MINQNDGNYSTQDRRSSLQQAAISQISGEKGVSKLVRNVSKVSVLTSVNNSQLNPNRRSSLAEVQEKVIPLK